MIKQFVFSDDHDRITEYQMFKTKLRSKRQ